MQTIQVKLAINTNRTWMQFYFSMYRQGHFTKHFWGGGGGGGGGGKQLKF